MSRQDYEGAGRKSPDRARAKEARTSRRASQPQIDWANMDWAALAILTEEMAQVGGAVRIGLTRDLGAWALGMYMEGDYAVEYIRPGEETATAIDEIARVWLPMAECERYFERVTTARKKQP